MSGLYTKKTLLRLVRKIGYLDKDIFAAIRKAAKDLL